MASETPVVSDSHDYQVASRAPIPVRVMHVVYQLNVGGMEHGVVKLVNGLDPALVRSSVCSTRPAGDLKSALSGSVRLFDLHGRPGNDVRVVGEMYRLFRRERPHIVHTHAWGTLIEGLAAAKLARVPVLIHGEHGTLQLKAYQRWVQRHAWAAVDQVLSVSSRLADRLSDATGFERSRVKTIRNGVDLERFSSPDRGEARRDLDLDPNQFVVGTIGRLVPVKDQRRLIDAVAWARGTGHDVTALVAGDGPLRAQLEQQASDLGIAEWVRFLGHRADVERILAALDVFVLSSSSEGLSNTILEAMSSGLPVVATRVGGADELVEHGRTGLLVPPGDSEALGRAIAELAASPRRRQDMGGAGRKRAQTDFGLARMIGSYTRLYLQMAAAAHVRTPAVTRSDTHAWGTR